MFTGWTEQRRLAKMKKSLTKIINVPILCAVLTLVLISSHHLFNSDFSGDCNRQNRHKKGDDGTNHLFTNVSDSPVNGSELNQTTTVNPNSYEYLDIGKVLAEEDEPEEENETRRPFSLGPKISNWDEQRANWLIKNPGFPNFVHRSKPRVLLVTGSSPKPCENRLGDHFMLKSIKNKMDYCRIHGIEIYYNMALLDAEMSGFWAKLPLIRKLMLSHPEVEFFWWMDSDAMFTDMAFELPWGRYNASNLVVHGWNEAALYVDKNWVALNTGSFLLRNTQWSLDLW
ncbi:hypothetical protein RND81_12G055500 [Saponaria officinalis]|uniref:Uncharacterized protein n=1 Tax=Saponaria officinalis TaxID=3572 RepID=A0AAW1H6I0_SAPOF